MPAVLSARAYNSAGELVRIIYSGSASGVPIAIGADRQLIWPGGTPVHLQLDGVLLQGGIPALWEGFNDQGQPVAAGTYAIKVETVDSFGTVTTYIVQVQVLPPPTTWSLKVMNSAGEIVANLPLSGLSSVPVDFSISSPTFAVDSSVLPGSGQAMKFIIRLADGTAALPEWNGLNQDGRAVESGIYYVVLYSNGTGGNWTVTRSVQVLKVKPTEGLQLLAMAVPEAQGGGIRIMAQPALGATQSIHASLWNMAGEKVRQASGAGGQSELRLESGGLSSGIYVAVVEVSNAGTRTERKILKVALVQ